jgi:hypothetical protein
MGLLFCAARAGAADSKQVPFRETLVLVGTSPAGDAAFYVGHGTHLGQIEAVEFFNPDYDPNDPDSVFATYVKKGANGDELYGTIIPDDPANPFTTGTITIDDGSGRFAGATGITRYVVVFDPDLGTFVADVEGTISSVGSIK